MEQMVNKESREMSLSSEVYGIVLLNCIKMETDLGAKETQR